MPVTLQLYQIQEEQLRKETKSYKEVLAEGAAFATEITRKKMIDVYTKIGLM